MASALSLAFPPATGPARAGTRVVAGTVVDGRTGGPVAGARVAVAPADHGADIAPAATTATGADGRFAITVEAGAWLLLDHPDFLPELLPAAASPERLSLTAPGAIWGRLCDGRGAPLAGQRVHASCPEALDLAEAESDASGAFCLTGLRPGRWLLVAVPPGAAGGPPVRAVVRITSGQTACADLRPGSRRPS